MPRFSGPQPGFKNPHNKGILRAYRTQKRKEAEERQRISAHKRKVALTIEEEIPKIQGVLDALKDHDAV